MGILEAGRLPRASISTSVGVANGPLLAYLQAAPLAVWPVRVGPEDVGPVLEQLRLLDGDLAKLEEKASLPMDRYLAEEDSQIVVERKLRTALESAANIGNHLIAALRLSPPADYASIFETLARKWTTSPQANRRRSAPGPR